MLGNGIAIAWWRKTLKGSSIADLHRSWAFSTSVKEIIFSLKYFNIVALAALTAKLTLIDSTLMQKALTFYNAVDQSAINITDIRGFASPTWPITGTVIDQGGEPGLMENSMGDTLRMWAQTGGSYPNQWHGCKQGFCYIQVPGIGFAFDCKEEDPEAINYGQTLTKAAGRSTDASTATLFDIKFSAVYFDGSSAVDSAGFTAPRMPIRDGGDSTDATQSSYLQMNVTYTKAKDEGRNSDCPGTKFKQTCKLWPAVVKYPVQIQNIPGASFVSVGAHRLELNNATTQYHNATIHLGNAITTNPDLAPFNQNTMQQQG